MAKIDVINQYSVASQAPLDPKLVVATVSELQDLGEDNFKAYLYYENMKVTPASNGVEYIWREEREVNEPNGLLVSAHTYPSGLVVNDIVYSNRKFNFFVNTKPISEIEGLQTEINDVNTRVTASNVQIGGQITVSLTDLTTTVKSSIIAAINSVKSELTTETNRAIAAEGAETSRATSAEGVIQANLDAEVSRASGAETVLSGRVGVNESDIDTLQADVLAVSSATSKLSFANLAAATAYWEAEVTKPDDNQEIFIVGLNDFYKWNAADPARAIFSRDYFKKNDLLIGWSLSDAFQYSNIIYDVNGDLSTADIKWSDEDLGNINNVTLGEFGYTSLRYNRSNGDYVTVLITYGIEGNVTQTTATLTTI